MPSNTATILALNDTPITGHNIRLNCVSSMPEADLSGQSSSTATAEGGFKPKKLTVSLRIKYDNEADLAALVTLSEATNDNGERTIYQIINQTAKAFNVRQARFSEHLTARESDGELSWQVSFVLLEHNSVPEKAEKQQVATDTTEGEPQALASTETATAETPERSTFENILAKADAALAPEDETTA